MRLKTVLLLTAAFTTPCSAVFAAPIIGTVTQIVSFGDSLSDGGNASIATAGAQPGPGYATRSVPGVPFPVGEFTNPKAGFDPSGVWVDQLAAKIGVTDPLPALAGGTNYAVGSALTGNANPQDMANRVGLFLTTNGAVAPPDALYTFWGGANDILGGQNPVTAADNIAAEIEAVAAAGGKNFLWLDLPDLGGLPLLSGDPVAAAAANLASEAFNLEWASQIGALDALGINVIGVDVEGIINEVNANPALYGVTNLTTPCAVTPGCNPNKALYWDAEHPTTEGHRLIADLAFDRIQPVPEPSTFVLFGTGVMGLAGAMRRRMAQRSSRA